jgi:ABC-2 type transport system permease protein
MTALVRGELIKTASTRTVLAYVAIGALLTIVNVLVVIEGADDTSSVAAKQDAIAGVPFVLFLLGLVGAAGEYRHRTAGPAALPAGRDRGALLLARAGAYAVTAVAVAALMAVVSLGFGLPMLEGEPGPALGFGDIAPVVGGTFAAAALAGIMGVAVGALVRNQVAAVVGALIVGFLVTPLIDAIDDTAMLYTPVGSMEVLAGDSAFALSRAGGALVLAAWTIVPLIAAIVAERRRDMA